jgi:hypothetical protein
LEVRSVRTFHRRKFQKQRLRYDLLAKIEREAGMNIG